MTYAEKLKDPRWQKMRLKVLERDNFSCRHCKDVSTTLHVHHLHYRSNNPWDAEWHDVVTLCAHCHFIEEKHKKTKSAVMKIKKFWNGNDLTIGVVYEEEDGFGMLEMYKVVDGEPVLFFTSPQDLVYDLFEAFIQPTYENV